METIEVVEINIHESGPSGDAITAALAINSVATAQQASALTNLAYGNQVNSTAVGAQAQVAHQDALNRLRHVILARAVSSVQVPAPLAARSDVFVFSSNELAQDIADLKAAVEAFVPTP
ncbi:MAG TPA: hypothetical protein VGN46_18810 [Luteibacter sp.]|jgi:hypothetical protein|uniref:hypothetical protein n=1 Tax=Luteibacter sp. TaxID=1886636 RepID=UPI002F41A8AD